MWRITWLVLAACGGGGGDDGVRVDAAPCVDLTHDEDGDGIGDRCDVCPATPDPLQRDTTEAATMIVFPDGVGDACDPRPSLSGDKLAALHTFADPASAADWTGTGWTIAGDRAHAGDTARWIANARALGDGLYVQARVARFDALPGGAFELVLDGGGSEAGLVCAITRDADGNDALEARELAGATNAKPAGTITGAITLTAWRVIDFQRRGSLRCRVTFDGGMAELDMPTTDDVAAGIYGFAARSASVDVTSIVVYTSPSLPGDH